ncbi:MAG TPA: tetratricopeptide repeat protein [Burkholderiales bacterium]|nr:tetratricopeptide repeat protein [Burkholderiales bacterium]
MNRKLLILLMPTILLACAQQPQRPASGAAAASEDEQQEQQEQQAETVKSEKLPKQELTEKMLYEFLLGEIAGQRGQLDVATKAYVDLAKTTRDPRIAQRATEIALYSKQPEAALQAARVWAEVDPDSTPARQTLVALLINSHQLDEARPHLEKLLADEGPNIGQGFIQLDGLLAKYPDKAAALNLVRDLAQPYPQLAEAHFALSHAAWNAGRYDLALSEVRKALELHPDWQLAALFQGQILQHTSNKLAIDYFHDYLKSYPKAKDVRLNYARLLVVERDYSQARSEFQRLRADFPNNAEVSLAVGLLSMQLNDFDAAEESFKQALSQNYKDRDSVRYYLGETYEERKRYDQALYWYGSVKEGEQYFSAQLRYASVLAKQGKLAEARKHLTQIPVQDNQQRIQVILTDAQLLREAGHYQEAFDLLGRALQKNPDYPDLLYDYAMAAEKLNRLDVLEENLRKLIQLKPDYAHAYNALGYTLADRTDRLNEAEQYIEQALKLAPEDPFIIDSMGWVQYRLGNLKEGTAYLRRAYADRPDPEIAAHLGEVLWVQGKHEEAQTIWNASLKENPDNEALQNVIKKFVKK